VPRALQVVTPMAMLYSREGVGVALISVEVWSAGVIVRLAGLPNARTEVLDREFHGTLDAWARGGREGRPRSGTFPSICPANLSSAGGEQVRTRS
jgi:hypothetical protein